jgi:flagella basal body P-ring formation protein FlgA
VFSDDLCVNNINIIKKGSRFTSLVNKDREGTFEIRGSYEVLADVVIANDRINRGEVITFNNVNLSKMNIAGVIGEVITNIDKILGMVASNSIMPNKLIVKKDEKLPNIIEKGQKVTMLYENRGLKIKMTGLALDSGKLGDIIRVRNTKSNATVSGVIKGEGLLQIVN